MVSTTVLQQHDNDKDSPTCGSLCRLTLEGMCRFERTERYPPGGHCHLACLIPFFSLTLPETPHLLSIAYNFFSPYRKTVHNITRLAFTKKQEPLFFHEFVPNSFFAVQLLKQHLNPLGVAYTAMRTGAESGIGIMSE